MNKNKFYSTCAGLFLLCLTVNGCGLQKGYIYDKEHIAAWTQYVPGHWSEYCETTHTTHGSVEDCTREYDPGYFLYHPAEYILYLSTCTIVQMNVDAHKCDTGAQYVTSGQYDADAIGTYVDFTGENQF